MRLSSFRPVLTYVLPLDINNSFPPYTASSWLNYIIVHKKAIFADRIDRSRPAFLKRNREPRLDHPRSALRLCTRRTSTPISFWRGVRQLHVQMPNGFLPSAIPSHRPRHTRCSGSPRWSGLLSAAHRVHMSTSSDHDPPDVHPDLWPHGIAPTTCRAARGDRHIPARTPKSKPQHVSRVPQRPSSGRGTREAGRQQGC